MKVIHAELQGAIVFHATKVTGIVTLNANKVPGIEMRWASDGLHVTVPEFKAKKITGFVPAANVKCLLYENVQDNAADIDSKAKASKALKAL